MRFQDSFADIDSIASRFGALSRATKSLSQPENLNRAIVCALIKDHSMNRNLDLDVEPIKVSELMKAYKLMAKSTGNFRGATLLGCEPYCELERVLEPYLMEKCLLERRKHRDLYAVPTVNPLDDDVFEIAEVVRPSIVGEPPLREVAYVLGIVTLPTDEPPKLSYALQAQIRDGKLVRTGPGTHDAFWRDLPLDEIVSYRPLMASYSEDKR